MRAYITGVAGFLGSHLADCLLGAGYGVSGCDDLSTGSLRNIPQAVDFEYTDITSSVALRDMRSHMKDCEIVYHCAAAAYEGVSNFSPAFISKNIYYGSANVFSAAVGAGVKRIVNCSSMARYGIGVPPFTESLWPQPVDPYGLAKLGAEQLLEMISATHGVEYVIAVPHNIYGPRQKYDDPYRNVAAIMINRLLQGKQPVIYGTGEQVRCFSYVDDVAPILAQLGFAKVAGEVINLGPDTGEVTINSLAQMICAELALPFNPIYVPERPREVKHATCSADKVRRLFGFEARTELRDGLKRLTEHIRGLGPKQFRYRLELEIETSMTPKTWTDKTI